MEPTQKTPHWTLRMAQRYLKTDLQYLLKGSAWLMIGQLIVALCGFVLALIFARYASAELYGNYRYVTAIAGILCIASLGGVNIALSQAVAQHHEGTFFTALKKKISWGLVGGLASLALGIYYYLLGNTSLAFGFLIIAPFIPFHESFSLYIAVLQGRTRFDLSVLYVSLSQIIGLVVLIGAILTNANLNIILLAYFVPWLVTQILFTKLSFTKNPLNTSTSPETIPAGIHISLINILPLITQQVDKVLLFVYAGPAQLAIYSFAVIIPDQIKMFLKSLQSIILPKFATKTHGEIHQSVLAKMLGTLILLVLLTLVYWIIAPFFYEYFFPQYTESVWYSQIYGISFIAAALVLPYTMLQAKLATRELYQANTASSLIQIGLMCGGIFYFGILGLILGRTISEFLSLGILMLLAKKIAQKS